VSGISLPEDARPGMMVVLVMTALARASRTTYGAVDESVSGISLPEDARPGMMVVLVMTALARVSRTTYGSVD
ncbi:hypothetical protein, partial [Aeromonas caviae]